ncbi:hypothetical protein BG452_22830 [Streptomyces sp. CBMA123]|nr:hypothetical protein [Streptomyces sp. CBMA123]
MTARPRKSRTGPGRSPSSGTAGQATSVSRPTGTVRGPVPSNGRHSKPTGARPSRSGAPRSHQRSGVAETIERHRGESGLHVVDHRGQVVPW